MTDKSEALIKVTDLIIKSASKTSLNIPQWSLQEENHVLIGPNASGKTLLASFIARKISVHNNQAEYAPSFSPEKDIQFVSFEFQQELFQIDDYNDDTDFLDYQDIGTRAEEIILDKSENQKRLIEVSALLKIDYLLKRGIRFLSTGEMRKVLIARALMKKSKLLIIDSPFEGLDSKSRLFMRQRLSTVIKSQQCLLIVNEDDPIISDFDRVTCLLNGKVHLSGKPAEVTSSPQWQQLFPQPETITSIPAAHYLYNYQTNDYDFLVDMKDISVKYGDCTALNKLNWQVKPGENWLISGPNGAGKSTLLSLVTGDNPQGYGQELYLFDRKRGSGETIWDIKRKIGIVNSQLQIDYKVPTKALEVILSGFHDSIGLYENCDAEMVSLSKQWLNILEIEGVENKFFTELSYGEQRMLLIARAMIKQPLILILDEPCQGLDKSNRIAILNLIDYIAQHCQTSILYVSHSHAEDLQCINRKLTFTADNEQRNYTAEITSL